MKITPRRIFINLLAEFFRLAVIMQAGTLLFLFILNYFSYDGEHIQFTVRGTVHAYENGHQKDVYLQSSGYMQEDTSSALGKEWKTNKYGVAMLNTDTLYAAFYLNGLRTGFLRIDYYKWSEAFTIKNIAWFLCDISIGLLWLLVTFQVKNILRSLKFNSVFIATNVRRITIIGVAVLLIPFVQVARDSLFFSIVTNFLHLPGYQLYSNIRWLDLVPHFYLFGSDGLGVRPTTRFPQIALGLIILAVAQIFKSGFELQKEKDLTI